MIKYVSLFALAVGVSACATTTPLAPGDPATVTQADVDASKAEILATFNGFIDESITLVEPTSGTAEYNGNIVLSDGFDHGYSAYGDLALSADFEAQTVTGTASNFNAIDLTSTGIYPTDGTLTDIIEYLDQTTLDLIDAIVGELAIDGTMDAGYLTAALTGELTGLDLTDQEITAVIDALMRGLVYSADGTTPAGIVGDVIGTGTIEGSSGDIGGFFLAN